MSRYILDTNVALAYIRKHELYTKIETDHKLTDPGNMVIISVVTQAELLSLGKQNNWGPKKMKLLRELLRLLIVIGISETDGELINAYANISALSQGKLSDKLVKFTPRNMVKNDLWIAATAKAADAKLITTDKDFDHLNSHFIEVIKYPAMSTFKA